MSLSGTSSSVCFSFITDNLPLDRFQSMNNLISHLRKSCRCWFVHFLSSWVKWSPVPIPMWHLSWDFDVDKLVLLPASLPPSQISSRVWGSLPRWQSRELVCMYVGGKFPSLCLHPRRQSVGWGTDLDNNTAQETWIPCESRKHLNSWIERWNTIPAYLGDVRQHNNLFYVSKQGDQNLILFAQRQNWNWCFHHHILLSPVHLPAIHNKLADIFRPWMGAIRVHGEEHNQAVGIPILGPVYVPRK